MLEYFYSNGNDVMHNTNNNWKKVCRQFLFFGWFSLTLLGFIPFGLFIVFDEKMMILNGSVPLMSVCALVSFSTQNAPDDHFSNDSFFFIIIIYCIPILTKLLLCNFRSVFWMNTAPCNIQYQMCTSACDELRNTFFVWSMQAVWISYWKIFTWFSNIFNAKLNSLLFLKWYSFLQLRTFLFFSLLLFHIHNEL